MAPLPQQLSQRRSGRAQANEHGREARHEQERGDQDVTPRLCLALVGQRLDARARKIAKIGRGKRQHAGRNKGDQARAERGREGDVSHGVTDGLSATGRQMSRRDRRRLGNCQRRDTACCDVPATSPPERRPGSENFLKTPHPAAARRLAARRRATTPSPAKPASNITQVEGSGTGAEAWPAIANTPLTLIAALMSFTAAALSVNMSCATGLLVFWATSKEP